MKISRLFFLGGIRCLLFIVLLGFALQAASQQGFKEIAQLDCQATLVCADHLGNLYTLEGSTLNCRDSSGKLRFSYSDLNAGPFSFVDVSDPLKILLFSQDFATLTFLDQKLARQGSPIALQPQGVSNATLACTSYQSGFWVYDASLIQLLRFDNQTMQVQNSDNISSLCGEEIKPGFLTEIGNNVYLCDTAVGILMFDRFGGYQKMLPFKSVLNVQAAGENLLLVTNLYLMVFQPTDHAISALPLPEAAISACTQGDKLFLLNGKSLKIFKMF
jgi:hypothetical protein